MVKVRRRLRLLLLALPVALAGTHLVPAVPAAAPWAPISLGPAVFVSAPRQSLPRPVHDEATCAFCQAAAFAPHAARATGSLAGEWLSPVHREFLSFEERLTHSGVSRPPRSRAPPLLRAV